MAANQSFFAYDTLYFNSMYALDIAVENYLKNLIFPMEQDLSRIIYASNEYTFRRRTDENSGNLNLPYISYHLKPGGFQYNNDWNWRNYFGYYSGAYLEELKMKAKFMPVQYDYECLFICNRDDEIKYASKKVAFDQGSVSNRVEYSVNSTDIQTHIPMLGKLIFDNVSIDDMYNEKDFLERSNRLCAKSYIINRYYAGRYTCLL